MIVTPFGMPMVLMEVVTIQTQFGMSMALMVAHTTLIRHGTRIVQHLQLWLIKKETSMVISQSMSTKQKEQISVWH